jgi:tRNA1(Val) A37 N6-methylase TrmN6
VTAPPAAPGLGALRCDGLLGGRVRLWQPRQGFRAGTDAVLLAAACPARPGEAVLDLGCGAGAAALCLAARVPALRLAGVEIDPGYAALARANAGLNAAAFEVVEADATAPLPAALRRPFAQVIANPPYHAPGGTLPAAPGLARARHQTGPLAGWIDTAARRLAPGGWLTLVLAADRLAEALAALAPAGRWGAVAVLPLAPRAGRAAERVILRARKGARARLRLLAPFVLHDGARHAADGDDHAPAAAAVLRDAAPLPFD